MTYANLCSQFLNFIPAEAQFLEAVDALVPKTNLSIRLSSLKLPWASAKEPSETILMSGNEPKYGSSDTWIPSLALVTESFPQFQIQRIIATAVDQQAPRIRGFSHVVMFQGPGVMNDKHPWIVEGAQTTQVTVVYGERHPLDWNCHRKTI